MQNPCRRGAALAAASVIGAPAAMAQQAGIEVTVVDAAGAPVGLAYRF